jgi:hypothetical protein
VTFIFAAVEDDAAGEAVLVEEATLRLDVVEVRSDMATLLKMTGIQFRSNPSSCRWEDIVRLPGRHADSMFRCLPVTVLRAAVTPLRACTAHATGQGIVGVSTPRVR